MLFEGKVAIVTGAGSGIGWSIARLFAVEGARVVIADISRVAGIRASEKIAKSGGEAISVPTDVADEAQVQALTESTLDHFGRIDILVNNAGIVVHKHLIDLDRKVWDRQMAVQLTGPFLVSKHVARHMIAENHQGKIVNISSVSAVMGRIKGGAHCVSKAGLTLLTKVLAMELGEYHINVNAVAPGLINVPSQQNEENLSSNYKTSYMQALPLGQMGKPSDIANLVLFLASPKADWITGQLFLVDGGLMAGHLSFQGTPDFQMLHGHE